METQKVVTITAPRITLKRTSVRNKVAWEIASSSSTDKEELQRIVLMIEEVNKEMEKRFAKAKEKKEEGK